MQFLKKLSRALCLGSLLSVAGPAFAAVVTLPAGLSPGTPYRLVFVTEGLATPGSTDIADYNSYVSNQANSSASLAALGTSWTALGSTVGVNARTNTSTDPSLATGVPIYNLSGNLVASNYADLWDGSLSSPINIDQNGNSVAQKVFTGTASNGTAIAGYELGSNVSKVQYGESNLTSSGWTSIDWLGTGTALHYYGISGILGEVSSVPVPAALPLFLSGIACLGLMSRRRRHTV